MNNSFTNITHLLANTDSTSTSPLSLVLPSATLKRKKIIDNNDSCSATASSFSRSNSSLYNENERDTPTLNREKISRSHRGSAIDTTLSTSEAYAQFMELDDVDEQMGGLKLTSFSPGKGIARSPKTYSNLCGDSGQPETTPLRGVTPSR